MVAPDAYVAMPIQGDDETARGEAFKACRSEAQKLLHTNNIELINESEWDHHLATSWRVKTAAA